MAKRIEIAIGQEWAFNRSRGAEIDDYGFQKVTIASVEHYQKGTYQSYKVSKGQGVLVTTDGGYEKVVQLSQLFKPWAEFVVEKAEYTEQRKIWLAKAAIEKAEREKFDAEVYRPALHEFHAVIKEYSGEYVSEYDRVNQLPIEVLQAIVRAIKTQKVA
jgi:hypothetical protein